MEPGGLAMAFGVVAYWPVFRLKILSGLTQTRIRRGRSHEANALPERNSRKLYLYRGRLPPRARARALRHGVLFIMPPRFDLPAIWLTYMGCATKSR